MTAHSTNSDLEIMRVFFQKEKRLRHCLLIHKNSQSRFGPDMTNEVDYKTEPDPTLISLLLLFYKPSIIWRKRSSHEYQRGKLFILFMIFRFLQPFRCKIIPPLGKRLFIRAVYLNISIFEGVHMKIYCCLLDGVNNSFFSRQAYTHFREEMPPKPHLLTWGPAFTKQHQISNLQ